nr:zinc finger, CCHC-type [Tanacetum cinerariifolium]
MVAAMKHVASNFAKLKKFKRVDFRRWQKKMHFLLSSMSVVYVLTTLMPEDGGDNPTVEQVRKMAKWDNDDYVCKGLILNGMSDSLFDVYQNVETSKELWDTLEAKYMAKDASSKKFLVSNFTNYKMTDSRPVLKQYNELFGILGRFTQRKMNMNESTQEELILIELGGHLRIEESLRAQDNDKPKGNNVVGPSVVNMVEHNNSSRPGCRKPGHLKRNCKAGNIGNKANGSGTKGLVDGSSNSLKGATVHVCTDKCWGVVRLPDPKMKDLSERGIECIFVGYAEHFKAFRFFVIEPNKSLAVNSIIESKDAIFDDNRFSSVSRPSLRIPNRTEDNDGSMVTEEDEVSDQHSYCFNVEDVPKIFNEAIKSQDVSPWKKAINDEIYFIMGNNTWVLTDLPPGCRPLVCKWIFKRKLKYHKTADCYDINSQFDYSSDGCGSDKKFLSSRFSMKDMGEADVILALASNSEGTEVLEENHGLYVDVYCYHLVLKGYIDASWINNTEDNSSTGGWVFLLGGGAISWASKKQTCITGSTIKSEFVALVVSCKEAEWLKNLLIEIPLWVKPIAPISICCDSAVTLAKACSQMYNRKSRHLGVRHSMIRELIMNGMVSIEFVRSQQNLADHLTNGLDRDLLIKSAEGMVQFIPDNRARGTECTPENNSAYRFIVHDSKNPDIQKNTVMESRNASFFENIFPYLTKETESSSRLDDEVVQDKRQRDENDLQVERQDQVEVVIEPRRGKRARTEKSFGSDYVSFMVENERLIEKRNDKMIKSTKDMLKSKFDMKDMGLADVILGIKIIRTQNGLVLSQAHYVDKILNTHNGGGFRPS